MPPHVLCFLHRTVHPRDFFLLSFGRGLRTALRLNQYECLIVSILDVPYSLIEYALQVPLRQSGALQVLLSLDFFRDNDGLSKLNGSHLLLPQALFRCLILSEI